MKVSEINIYDLANYLRLDPDSLEGAESTMLETILSSAKAFIKSYTGLTETRIDEHEDFTIVVFILAQDMNDNRVLYVEKDNINKTVETILGMHSVNLL